MNSSSESSNHAASDSIGSSLPLRGPVARMLLKQELEELRKRLERVEAQVAHFALKFGQA